MQKCKILIRDGKISAMMSNGYSILPADELVGALEKELKKEHKDMKMLSATISHEYLNIEYLLNDKDADKRKGAEFSAFFLIKILISFLW